MGRTKRLWRKIFYVLWYRVDERPVELRQTAGALETYLFPPNFCTRNTVYDRSTFYIHLYPWLLDSDAVAGERLVVVVDVTITVNTWTVSFATFQADRPTRESQNLHLWYHPQKTITAEK